MAASIRVRIQLGTAPLNATIDPFWLLIHIKDYPLISDIGRKILSVCNSVSFRPQRSIANDNVDEIETETETETRIENGDAATATTSFSSLQTLLTAENEKYKLWLDGCRLLDSEKSEILRDNDSITVDILTQDSSSNHDVTSKYVKTEKQMSMGSHSRKGKRSKSVDQDDSSKDLESCTPKKKKKREKDHLHSRKKYQKVEDGYDNPIFSQDFNMTDALPAQMKSTSDIMPFLQTDTMNVEDTSSLPKEKKRKKKGRSSMTVSFSDDIVSKEACKKSTNHYSAKGISFDSSTPPSDIEEHKRNLLGKLETIIHSAELQSDELKKPHNDDDKVIPDVSLDSKQKKRRRRRKKSNKKEESKVVRIEDKPRSSKLNLPWDMQPQNSKITFESDSDKADQEGLTKSGKKMKKEKFVDRKVMNLDDGEDDAKNEGRKLSKINVDDAGEKKVNERSYESQAKLISKRYKDLSHTGRKYLMRSTAGILDSLRSNSSTNGIDCSPLDDAPVKGKSHNEHVSYSPLLSGGMTEMIESGMTLNDAPVAKTNIDALPQQKSTVLKPSSHEMSNVHSEVKFDQQERASSSPIANHIKTDSLIPSPSKCVDYDSKFNELLQRRRMSSTVCNVHRSENGITICSRSKSPNQGLQAHRNRFADPDTDLLINVSTIKKFNGTADSTDASLQKLPPRGKCAVQGTSTNGITELEKVEVIPLDVENCPRLAGNPNTGDILAFKILEMNENYTPIVSDFKTGKVLSFESGLITLELFGSPAPKKLKGKFDLVYDDEEETSENSPIADEQINVDFASMMDTRLVQRYNTDKGKQ